MAGLGGKQKGKAKGALLALQARQQPTGTASTASTAATQSRQPAGRPPPTSTGGGRTPTNPRDPNTGGAGVPTPPGQNPWPTGQQPLGTSFPGAGPNKFGLIPGGSENEPGYDWLSKGTEYFNPQRLSVAPAGSNLLAALMGGRAGSGNLGDWTGLGTLFDDGGTGDPLHQSRLSLDKWLKTGGVVDSTQELAKGRFASNALWDEQAGQQQTFGDWFDVGNLNGASSPLIQRLMGGGAADWGYDGQQGALETQPFKGFQFIQQALAQNPNLDPEAERAFADKYTQDMKGTATAPGARSIADILAQNMAGTDTYGKAHHIATELGRDTSRLNNDYESGLMRDIDTEAQRSLAMQLPEVQAQMAAAGMDRSGASRGAAAQLFGDVIGQSNRDKQRLLGQFAETGRGIEANALGQGAQGVFGAIEGSAGRDAQGFLTGAQGRFGALDSDASRMSQAILQAQGQGGQAMQREHERYMGEQDNYLRAILGSESARLQGLGGQLGGQQQAQSAFQSLFGQQEDSYYRSLESMLGTSEQQRQIDQQRLVGQIQAGQVPLELLKTLSTGTTGSFYQPQQVQNPWAGLGSSAAGSMLGGLAQNIGNGGAAPGGSNTDWLMGLFGGQS